MQNANGNEFRILGDVFSGYGQIDAIAQFMYKGFEISMSTVGRSKGACMNMVVVFGGSNHSDTVHEAFTVEEAIDWINAQ